MTNQPGEREVCEAGYAHDMALARLALAEAVVEVVRKMPSSFKTTSGPLAGMMTTDIVWEALDKALAAYDQGKEMDNDKQTR